MNEQPDAPPGWAAIFDWDGVVIDSSRHHLESWERLAAEERRELPDGHFHRGFGMRNEIIIPEILGWSREPAEIVRISLRKEEIYRTVVREWGIDCIPGVREFLADLRRAGVPCIIGSSTHRINIETALERLGVAGAFSAMVTSEDVSRGKPDPEVFEKSARKLGFPADRCVVFEDAPAGIRAARRAGMRVIAVATTHERTALWEADRVVGRLDEIPAAEIAAWMAGEGARA